MPTDEMLAAKTLNGEIAAFEELLNRYKKSVFAIIFRMIGNYHEAEDITQEVFVTVYHKMYQFDQSKKFGPWIHRIAVNTCISSMRKNNKVVLINFDESFTPYYEPDPRANRTDPQQVLENQELRREIEEALLELPESYRTIIILRYQLDLTNQEIADILGISRENVEVKVHRARKALRKTILKHWDERGQKYELPAL
ncbi:RNA polymerase sigma factor, region 2 [Syntrophomonas zehnderi OL-4]|uniref:RNA polymerase sigma factor n=1 Tax=Syntrophomonas zehnderi OL-4 TaxID=690567 RepID=A0A0E4GBG5_9FIRM|nr:RNA polymerase sigma factor [Syntrophomonas zehnderi]CFX69049.1 RNA polymerase sigma factor, region 2 [Syntrophomonas zehnderi OL-4]